jgi:glycine/D-amino acid oxidase-like deaminating enzyme
MIEGDAVVIAMGPWSILAALSLPLPAVFGLKGHSIVFDTGNAVPGEALFIEYRKPAGAALSPEIFPRADGTTYVCAISSETPLPIDPAQVAPDPGAIERLEAICASLSPVLSPTKSLARQACYRPITADGLPLIRRVPGVAGAYVATGPSVWGILNALATGEAMAELIVDGVAHNVDLQPFDPSRLPPVEPEAISEAAANLHRDRQKRRHPVGSNNNPAGSRDGIDDSGWALGLSMRDRTFARMLISRDSPRS